MKLWQIHELTTDRSFMHMFYAGFLWRLGSIGSTGCAHGEGPVLDPFMWALLFRICLLIDPATMHGEWSCA